MIKFDELVAERLALCGLDMGLSRTWATAPASAVEREELPCAYTLFGATFAPSVVTQGLVNIGRTYIQRFLLLPFDAGATDSLEGAEANVLGSEWLARLHFYYHARPRLGSASFADLRYCHGIRQITDSGLVIRRAPGGASYAAIDLSLNIVMAAASDRVATPYN